jgi:hypothetical protein
MKSLLERIRLRCEIDPASGCWRWRQFVNGTGYPMMHVSGLTPHPLPVRRLVYLIAVGPLHKARVVTTTCGDELCCAPEHLVSRLRAEIAAETLRQVNRKITLEQRQRTGAYKLDAHKAHEIKVLASHGLSSAEIAAQFEVSAGLVRRIVRGEIWRNARPNGPFSGLMT